MLAEGLAILQGLNQLQTANVGQQANAFGSRARWNAKAAGNTIWVNALTGRTRAELGNNQQALNALGSQGTPYKTLEEALASLAAPATPVLWATPRNIALGPGEYTVGAQVIRRPLNFMFDVAAAITDTVNIANDATTTHTGSFLVGFVAPPGFGQFVQYLQGGIQIDQDGTSTRAVNLALSGIRQCEVNIDADVPGTLTVIDGGAELHAGTGYNLVVQNGSVEGTTLECRAIHAYGAILNPDTVTCEGTVESRLYATRAAGAGAWTGGTVQIDGSTHYDLVTVNGWTKANPGGTSFTVMT